ncbi:glycosyltransferase [Bacillus sp. PAMC26568]|nr:glycosyltransferase [Bacillus sp. PAMC26568]
MKKIIVYYPYELRELTSGSAVRPVKMLEGFRKLADEKSLEMIEIYGDSAKREQLLNDLYKNVNPADILYCYMENATIPMWLTDKDHFPRKPFLDYKFMKFLKRNNIPLGVFYRDAYWKFNDLYQVKPGIKQVMQQLFRTELSMFKKYGQVFYLPSKYMNDYVSFPAEKVVPLPPGGMDLLENKVPAEIPNAIYVGGINPRYGVYDMLQAFKELNAGEIKIHLHFVCRKEEIAKYQDLIQPFINEKWITIYHAFGDQLVPIYRKADFGIVPIQRDVYNDFAVAVKLFEYLSYGLPVISTDVKAQKDLVEDGDFGLVVQSSAESILTALKKMEDPEVRKYYQENAIKALKNKHLWYNRALTVHNTLSEKK